jgi:hypothetical protein
MVIKFITFLTRGYRGSKIWCMAKLIPDDSDSVMGEVGEVVPVILREAMDSGFDAFRRSRALDPVGHADYRQTTLANMLADRIYPFLIALVAAADPEGLLLRTRLTDNGRATELWIGSELYAKVKRIKDRVRPATPEDDVEVDGMMDLDIIQEGLPQNVPTGRVIRQRLPGSYTGTQMPLTYPGVPPVQVPDDGRERLCLVAGFDLDVTEERLERHRIGLYEAKRSLWTRPLPELELDAIVRISPSLADQVNTLRQARQA